MAVKLAPSERRRSFCGTPNFMAPEIVKEQEYGYAADSWSFGVLLLTLAVGKPPLHGLSKEAVF
jgi:serine/threonine protein kinase